MVPKAISLTLVSYSKENLQRELLQELYKPEVLDELLKESDFVVSRRKELQSMVAALNKAEEYVLFTAFHCTISSCFLEHRSGEPLLYTRRGACLYVVPKHEANMCCLLFIGLSPVSKHVPGSRTLFTLHWHFRLVMDYEPPRIDDIYDLSPNIHHCTWCNSLSFTAIHPYRYYNTLLFMCTPDRSCFVSNPFLFLTSEVC